MPHRSTRPILIAGAAVILASASIVAPVSAHAPSGPHVRVVAHGLDNPRGITVGRDGRVLVAVAGKGGSGTDGYGTSGKIVEIRFGSHPDAGRRSAVDDQRRGRGDRTGQRRAHR